jgi:GH35 family endo-1,4-beta-xylanase
MYEIDEDILAEARARIAQDRKWDVQLTLSPPANVSLSGSTVTATLTRHAFRFGCNGFQLTALRDADLRQGYEGRFDALLNYATLPFYWGSYEATQGVTRERALRQMAAWCRERDIATKGHPLVWHEVYPQWAAALSDEQVLRLLRQRIGDLVGGFRGLVDTWDVVNEATVSHRFDNAIGRYLGDRPSAAVDELLRLAHDANPDAELLYNDFNVRDPSCDRLVRDLVDGEAPMSAIGIQSHMHSRTWPLQEAWEICERYARFGLPLHYTELTVLSGRPKDPADRDWHTVHTDWPTTPEGEEAQLRYGEAIYTLLYSHPAVDAITWWDFADYQAWQGAPAGLLRADMSPKPLYERLMELVWDEWATHYEGTIRDDTTLTVSCAAGEHAIEIALPSGERLSGTFSVAKGEKGPIAVSLEKRGER